MSEAYNPKYIMTPAEKMGQVIKRQAAELTTLRNEFAKAQELLKVYAVLYGPIQHLDISDGKLIDLDQEA